MKPLTIYCVETNASWYLVKAQNARLAMKDGRREYGKGWNITARKATQDEIDLFISLKGPIDEAAA